MNTNPETMMNAVRAVSITVCTITTAVMCANLVAYSRPHHDLGKPTIKVIYTSHGPKSDHA